MSEVTLQRDERLSLGDVGKLFTAGLMPCVPHVGSKLTRAIVGRQDHIVVKFDRVATQGDRPALR